MLKLMEFSKIQNVQWKLKFTPICFEIQIVWISKMLKSFMWLATGHLGIIKMFGHFTKLLCYLFGAKQIKEKENRKKK